VYQIPVGGEDDKDKAVTYALQKVFYQLQTSNEPVGAFRARCSWHSRNES